MGTLRLGVNIDHIATLRQARYATMPDSKNAEPDPIAAASICERAGAHGSGWKERFCAGAPVLGAVRGNLSRAASGRPRLTRRSAPS